MSILIKGMEMPEKGYADLRIYADGHCVEYAGDIGCVRVIVNVPPHGRLIDADALAERLGITDMDCFKCAWGNHGFCGRGGDFNDACEAIEDAPTIIEAEVDDG